MTNQALHQRIKIKILDPVAQLFGHEFNEVMIEALIEDLSGFSEEELAEGMKILRRNCKRNPSIAHILESCNEARKSKISVPKNNPRQAQEMEFLREADSVMRTDFGQMALREGWGAHLHAEVRRTGRKEWSISDASRFRIAMQAAVEGAMECDVKRQRDPFAETLYRIWQAMRDREKELYSKFSEAV